MLRGRSDRYGTIPEDRVWDADVQGAAGEMAVAKWAGLYWNGNLGDLKADDVARLQVRTAAKHGHCLILHRPDPDDRAFVLVTGQAPDLLLQGWIMARDGKQQQYWLDPTKTGRWAYFIPPRELRQMVKPRRLLGASNAAVPHDGASRKGPVDQS